jgi:hypothetical protein
LHTLKLQYQMNAKHFLVACFAATLACTAMPTHAQSTTPAFEVKVGSFVNKAKFLLQAATGELITANDLNLMAIDPVSKTVIWENNDFIGLEENDLQVIEGTPFIKIERQKTLALAKNKNTYIIQASNGKIIYDSKEEGIKVRSTLLLPELNGLLMESVKEEMLTLSFIDFASATQKWSVPLLKEKTGGFGLGALKRAIKSHFNSAFKIAPTVDANGSLIVVYKKEIFCINNAGSLAWKKEYENNVDDAYISTDKKALFIGYKKYIDKINTADGASLLGNPIKMRDELNGIKPMGNDYIVFNEAGINVMDANGKMKWAKDTKLGNIKDVRFTANGILAIQPVDEDESVLHWVDLNGKEIWDEELKGAITMAEPTAKGVMYVTNERSNILTYEKGKDVWDKDIKMKGIPNFGVDEQNRILYAYANEKLHAFSFKDMSYRLVAQDLELKKFDEEEEQLKFDFRNNGAIVVISSNQNVLAVQIADGKINYNNYFKDIGHSRKTFFKVLGTAAAVYGAGQQIGGLGNMPGGMQSLLSEGNASSFNNAANNYASGAQLNAAGNALYEAASKRFMASQTTKSNLYILSEMTEGNGLLVWSKEKGEITKKIFFSDVTPTYVVDESDDRLYVMVGNTLTGYDLK